MAVYWNEFLALALVHLLAVVAPGPDFAVTVRQSVRYGRRAGALTALGIGAGISVHVLYTLLGVFTLMHALPWLMSAVALAGALYLAYLGLLLIIQARGEVGEEPPQAQRASKEVSGYKSFMLGFITNALNPKATLFFLAIFVTLVSPQTPLIIKGIYGIWMCLVNAGWFVLVSLVLTKESVRLRFLASKRWFDRVIGSVLLVFSLRLFWMVVAE